MYASPQMEGENLNQTPPKKAAFGTKETVITRVKSKASQACPHPDFSWRAPVFTDVHAPVFVSTQITFSIIWLLQSASSFGNEI